MAGGSAGPSAPPGAPCDDGKDGDEEPEDEGVLAKNSGEDSSVSVEIDSEPVCGMGGGLVGGEKKCSA